MSELALDDDDGNAFVRHLDGVGVPQLVRCEPTSDTSDRSRSPQLLAGSRRLPMTAGGGATDDAQQRAERKVCAELEPGLELIPRPAIHANLSATATLAATNQDSAALLVQIGFGKTECLADPQACAPEQDDQRTEPVTIGTVACRPHHRDDLVDRRRVSRIAKTLVTRSSPVVIAGHRRRRAAMTGSVQ